jgi:CDP-glycerol glycerophosphotransferase (TagB/SpsB family)
MLNRTSHYADLFAKYRPQLVVVTRALGTSEDYALMREAAQEGIPVAVLAASWDNLTSKGFFPFGIDHLVVWNDVMKGEAVELFGFDADRIFVSGVPRLDPFFDRARFRARDEFVSDLGLDPNKRIITYTTGNKDLFVPHESTTLEPLVIRTILEAIDRRAFDVDVQMIVRIHPQGDPQAYAEFAKNKNVYLQVPGKPGIYRDRDLDNDSNRLLGETMLHSDVVVNIASTTTIDAAIFDTPVVCVAYDPGQKRPFAASCRRFYAYDHYQKIANTCGFQMVASPQELIEAIRDYLQNPAQDSAGRADLVRQQCQHTDGRSGNRVALHLLEIVGLMPRRFFEPAHLGPPSSGTVEADSRTKAS